MTRLIVLKVERSIHKRKIREQALGAHAAGQAEQIIVRIARIIAHTLLDAENLDRENRRLALTQTALGHQQQMTHDHAALWRGIHAIVDRGERRLRTRAGMHGIQVMDECLHRLIGAAFGFTIAAVDRIAHDARNGFLIGNLQQAAAQLAFKRLVRLQSRHKAGLRLNLAQERLGVVVAGMMHEHQIQTRAQRTAILLDIGLGHARRHVIIKAGNRLTAVLIVLIGLNGDTGQRGIAADILRLTQHTMTSGETILKQARQINLRAGSRQRQEVHVMDVDITLAMRLGMLGIEHIHVIKLLGALAAILEHRTHRGIAVNICILTLDVGIRRVLEGDILQDMHQAGLRLTSTAALGAIENIGLGRLGIALVDEDFFHHVLHALDRRHIDAFVAIHLTGDHAGQALRLVAALGAIRRLKGAQNRRSNLFLFVFDLSAVTLDDILRHCVSPIYRPIFCRIYTHLNMWRSHKSSGTTSCAACVVYDTTYGQTCQEDRLCPLQTL